MTRRRWVFLGLAAVLLLGLASCLLWPVPRAVRAYERLRLGMTQQEVEAAIGEPPSEKSRFPYMSRGSAVARIVPFTGDVVRENGVPYRNLEEPSGESESATPTVLPFTGWQWNDHEQLWVAYDRSEQVIGYYLVKPWPYPPTLLERVRTRVGL